MYKTPQQQEKKMPKSQKNPNAGQNGPQVIIFTTRERQNQDQTGMHQHQIPHSLTKEKHFPHQI